MADKGRMREDLASAVEQAHMLASSIQLWPGWDPRETPLVLHNPEIAYVVGHPSPPEGYAELEPVACKPVFAGPRQPEMAANTARSIADVLCALVTFPSEPIMDAYEFARLILHECFHVHQKQCLARVSLPDWRVMGRYPESDPVNNAMCRVENKILTRALTSLSAAAQSATAHAAASQTAAQATAFQATAAQAAARFLAVREARHRVLCEKGMDEVCVYETGSEFNEGMPTLIEIRAGKPLSEVITYLEQMNIGGKWAASARFYFTGAAIGLLLDALMPGWQARLAEGGHALQSLLATAAPSLGPLPNREQVLADEGYQDILAAEQASEKERLARIEAMYMDINCGSGIPVEIVIPDGAFTLFNPTNIVVVKPGTRFHPTLTGLRGPSGLTVDINRLCLEDSDPRRLVVRLPEAPTILPVEPFSLKGEGISVSAPRAIVEDKSDGGYRIRFM